MTCPFCGELLAPADPEVGIFSPYCEDVECQEEMAYVDEMAENMEDAA